MIPNDVVAAAQASHKKFWPKGPFVSVSLAQWALESNWGKSPSGINNFWGIQANAEQKATGHFRSRLSFEFVNGQRVSRVEDFANYATLQDGFDAHATLLCKPHYAACMQAQTPEAYCAALHICGYATAPNYSTVLIDIIRSNTLKQWDQPIP